MEDTEVQIISSQSYLQSSTQSWVFCWRYYKLLYKGTLDFEKALQVDDETDLFVVDVEGLESNDASRDTRLVTLAILISSVFLYNSVGVIDEGAIRTLAT